MIRKTALLYSMTAALMIGAPAIAQEQTQDENATAAAEATPQAESLTLNPGTTVKSADGSELGKLVGAQNGATGQELTVRGADGTVRAVSVQGVRMDGSDIVVAASLNDYMSAAPIAEEADKAEAPVEEPYATEAEEPDA